jgi:hypothetical protein
MNIDIFIENVWNICMDFIHILFDLKSTQALSFLGFFVSKSLALERFSTLFIKLFNFMINLANLDTGLAVVVAWLVGYWGTATPITVMVFSLVKAHVVLTATLLILVVFELRLHFSQYFYIFIDFLIFFLVHFTLVIDFNFQLHLDVLPLVDQLIRLAKFLLLLLQVGLKIMVSPLFFSDNLNVFLLHLFALISFNRQRTLLALEFELVLKNFRLELTKFWSQFAHLLLIDIFFLQEILISFCELVKLLFVFFIHLWQCLLGLILKLFELLTFYV